MRIISLLSTGSSLESHFLSPGYKWTWTAQAAVLGGRGDVGNAKRYYVEVCEAYHTPVRKAELTAWVVALLIFLLRLSQIYDILRWKV